MADYGEIFCQATEQLIQNALAGQKYDITKDCTVVTVPKKSDGLYSVSDGSVTFDAYAAAGASYIRGDQVLVTIPQGDWSKQKTIINKIVTDSSGGIGYQSPMESFIKGTGNLILTQSGSLEANSAEPFKELYSIRRDDGIYFGFKKIALTGEFMTQLSGLNIISGEYGVKIFIYGDNKDKSVADLTWSASDMLGNPYEFSTYFKQEIVFDIPSTIRTITRIDVVLYQDCNFKDGNGVNFTPLGMDNIFVKNLTLYLGFQGGYTSKEVVEIGATDLTYTMTDNIRHIALRWFHKLQENIYEPVNMENINSGNYEVRWYQYENGTEENDDYGGSNWKWLNKNGEPDLTHEDYPFVLPVELLPSKNTEKFKAIGFVKEYPLVNNPTHEVVTHFESDVLTFTNVGQNPNDDSNENTPADVIRNTFSLNFDDGSYGNYFLYDQNGVLIDSANQGSSKERSITIFAYDDELNSDYELYNYIDYIKWEVPGGQSMITYSSSQAFINPNETIVNEVNKVVEYGVRGSFDFSTSIKAPKVGQLKINICTSIDGEDWNRSPYAYTASLQEGLNTISNVFTINRDYSYLKITLEYYDNEGKTIEEDLEIQQLYFKLKSTFHTNQISPVENADGTLDINNKFWYSIANNWNQSRVNNTIKCTISVAGVETVLTETLRFGKKGTSGTGNTFILEMMDGKNALVPGEELRIEALLIGQDGRQIYFTNDTEDNSVYKKIEWSILGYADDTSAPIYIVKSTEQQEVIKLFARDNIDLKYNYCILQAAYEYEVADSESGTTPILYAYLPIPIKANHDVMSMSGATQVIYNHRGQPSYSTVPYVLFKQDNSELKDGWNISYPVANGKNANPNPLDLKTATVAEDGKVLSATVLYSKGEGEGPIYDNHCVYYLENDTILWSQPILILQSEYDFAMLNAWNGSLTIDENNGTILATMLGAGKKDTQNRFSGVLIGDVREGTDNQSADALTGVYGFDKGIVSYALRENGTASFGTDLAGRIEIDGTSGIISSAGWEKKDGAWELNTTTGRTSGSLFDLTNGIIHMKNGTNFLKLDSQNGLTINASNISFNSNIFNLDAGDWTNGRVILTTTPIQNPNRGDTAAYYFGVGAGNDWICFSKANGLQIKTKGASIILADQSDSSLTGYITAETGKITTQLNDLQSNVESTFEQLPNQFLAQVQDTDSGFQWSLTTSGFVLKRKNGSAWEDVFNCNSGGLTVAGNGTFSGELVAAQGTFSGNLTASSTSFNKLVTAPIKIDGEEYSSVFENGTIRLVVGNPDPEGTTDGTGGALYIGKPSYDDWDDVTLWGEVIHEHVDQSGYGNIGTPKHYWSHLYVKNTSFRTCTCPVTEGESFRDFKYDIQPYNNEQAYDELKSLPLYTYKYKNLGDYADTLSLGTMIDYMPVELMTTRGEDDGKYFNLTNTIFWNIATTQVLQNKVEALENTVEALTEQIKILEEEKYNGIN